MDIHGGGGGKLSLAPDIAGTDERRQIGPTTKM